MFSDKTMTYLVNFQVISLTSFFLQPNTYLMLIPYYIFSVPQDMAYFSNICWRAMCCYQCHSVIGALSSHVYIWAGLSVTLASKQQIQRHANEWHSSKLNNVELCSVTLLLLSRKINERPNVCVNPFLCRKETTELPQHCYPLLSYSGFSIRLR